MRILKILCCVAVAVCLSSCVTQKMRAKICNSCAAKTEVRDSVYQVECWDTVRLSPITGPTIYLQNPCDSLGHLKYVSVAQTKNGVKGSVKSIDNTLVFVCETDSLKAYIKTLTEKYVSNKKHDAEVKVLPCENERTRFDGFTYWWFWISLAFLLLWFVIKVFRAYMYKWIPH